MNFDKVKHGILLHKPRDLCITGRLGLWLFSFLNHWHHCVRIPVNLIMLWVEYPSIVLSPLLFLIMMFAFDKNTSPSSKPVSFTDDTIVLMYH